MKRLSISRFTRDWPAWSGFSTPLRVQAKQLDRVSSYVFLAVIQPQFDRGTNAARTVHEAKRAAPAQSAVGLKGRVEGG